MKVRIAIYMLQGGVAFSLLYPPFAALSDPYSWVGYFPQFVYGFGIEQVTLLHLFGAFEVLLALWIISGWRIYIPSAITGVLLLLIVVFNMPQFPVLFRDISIAAAAFALAMFTCEHFGSKHPDILEDTNEVV